jgi:hypothetical protein
MKIKISKAEQDSQAIFDELVGLGVVPEPLEDILFAHNVNSTLRPVGLPRKMRVPLQSEARFVTLPRGSASKSRSSIFRNTPSA